MRVEYCLPVELTKIRGRNKIIANIREYRVPTPDFDPNL